MRPAHIGLTVVAAGAFAAGMAFWHFHSGDIMPASVLQMRQPSALPYRDGMLLLAGARVPITLERVVSGRDIILRCTADGQPYEDEVYRDDLGAFVLRSLGEETYSPAIPLLRYPIQEDSPPSRWKGTITGDGRQIVTSATITTEPEILSDVPGGPYDSLHVRVKLVMGAGMVERNLDFWFVDGKGIVKRQAGNYSTREPR